MLHTKNGETKAKNERIRLSDRFKAEKFIFYGSKFIYFKQESSDKSFHEWKNWRPILRGGTAWGGHEILIQLWIKPRNF